MAIAQSIFKILGSSFLKTPPFLGARAPLELARVKKNKTSQKWRPMPAYNPYFLLQNPVIL